MATTVEQNVHVQVLSSEVLDDEVVTQTITLSSGETRTCQVATGRLIVVPERLAAEVEHALYGTALTMAGAPVVLDENPAALAWLTVDVPVLMEEVT